MKKKEMKYGTPSDLEFEHQLETFAAIFITILIVIIVILFLTTGPI